MPDFTVNYTTGSTLYVTALRLGDSSSHTITLTDNADGTHTGNMPSTAGLGQYECVAYKQLGASPDPDTDTLLYPIGIRIWSGAEFDFDKSTGMSFEGLRS